MANTSINWSEDQIIAVWEKGIIVPGCDPNKIRKDLTGAWISYAQYGVVDDDFGMGWEIDHRVPKSLGGTDDISNLRPLQWSNNRSKGDNCPVWTSVVSSDGDINIKKIQTWTIN